MWDESETKEFNRIANWRLHQNSWYFLTHSYFQVFLWLLSLLNAPSSSSLQGLGLNGNVGSE
jgi:hypothetical protein